MPEGHQHQRHGYLRLKLFSPPPPLAALAQELRALARNSRCVFSFRPLVPAAWNFFSQLPLTALAQDFRTLARKSSRGFRFGALVHVCTGRVCCHQSRKATSSVSWVFPFGTFFRQRPRGESAHWLENYNLPIWKVQFSSQRHPSELKSVIFISATDTKT